MKIKHLHIGEDFDAVSCIAPESAIRHTETVSIPEMTFSGILLAPA